MCFSLVFSLTSFKITNFKNDRDRDLYMKIWDVPEIGFPKDVFQKIEKAITTTRPFYNNIYYLFSIGRVCNYVDDLRKLRTVAVVELRSFFVRNNVAYFKDLYDWRHRVGEHHRGGTRK